MRRVLGAVVTAAAAIALAAPAGVAFGAAGVAQAGTLQAWGRGKWGDLGDGTTADQGTPVAVKLPPGVKVVAVATGLNHSLALTSAGGLLAWGINFHGELGDGTTQIRHVPVPVKLPRGVTITAVAAGCNDSLALTSTGRVLAWGRNSFGELGDGSKTSRDVPVWVKLPPGIKVTAIDAGCLISVALTSAGRLLAWGRNDTGELGNGNHIGSTVPIPVRLPKNVKFASFGRLNLETGDGYFAITATGQVYTWSTLPIKINISLPSGVGRLTTLYTGDGFDLVLTSRGVVLSSGLNNHGQLGDGTTTYEHGYVRVKLPPSVRASAIVASGYSSYALASNGRVYAWGQNFDGSLGNGQNTDSYLPGVVQLPAGLTATAIAANGDAVPENGQHAFAIVSRS
jgi:alpha-tubulin suppressor-like RCC1 family protein